MVSSSVDVNGCRVVYRQCGSGPDLIWGHGLTSSMAAEDTASLIDWSTAAAPFTVTRYDARGHGESDSTADLTAYAWEQLALDQLALADRLGIGRFVAAGASMGAGTALHTAVAAPERVRALVLVIPPTGWEGRSAQTERYATMAAVVDRHGAGPLVDAAADLPPPDPFRGIDGYAALAVAGLRDWEPERLARVFRGATHAQLPDRDALRTIAVPALVLAWSGDDGHPESTAVELGALLPAAEVFVARSLEDVIGGTTQPGFTGRLRRFLEGLRPDPPQGGTGR